MIPYSYLMSFALRLGSSKKKLAIASYGTSKTYTQIKVLT